MQNEIHYQKGANSEKVSNLEQSGFYKYEKQE